MARPSLIVNRKAAAGRAGRSFDAVARAVREAIGDFEAAFTAGPGDGARLARDAATAGSRLVVAVGGDGTASEVVDGLAGHPRARGEDLDFGFIPRGTGGDLRRTLGVPKDPEAAARGLGAPAARRVDLGRVEFVDHGGGRAIRHFANVASCGISARAADLVNRGTKALGGRVAFTVAAARALLGWRDEAVRWRADGGPWQEARITALSVCNGRYYGGGMMVAPHALVDDGLFDVVVWSGFSTLDLLTKQRHLYSGRHVELPNTRVVRAREVEVEPLDAPVAIEVDGEAPGRLPARFTVQPGALRLRGGALLGASGGASR